MEFEQDFYTKVVQYRKDIFSFDPKQLTEKRDELNKRLAEMMNKLRDSDRKMNEKMKREFEMLEAEILYFMRKKDEL